MKKPHVSLGLAPQLGAVGLQPFESRNIRLSSALCALGFALNIDKEPATVVIDFVTQKPVVSFWHAPMLPEDSLIRKQLPQLTAYMVGMWWAGASRPDGPQYSIDGYDDALFAMRRVFEAREWLIGVAKGMRIAERGLRNDGPSRTDGRNQRGSVATESLHIASVIKACGIPLLAFDKGTFVFGKEAAPIATQIDAAEGGSSAPSLDAKDNIARGAADPPARLLDAEGEDPCVDWMLWALKYRDWLGRIVRQKECMPLIEKRDGERCLRIRADMPKTLRREFTRRF